MAKHLILHHMNCVLQWEIWMRMKWCLYWIILSIMTNLKCQSQEIEIRYWKTCNMKNLLRKNDAGTWDITNMGALMIAKDLKKFESLHRRTVRVIWYKENSRLDAIREKEFCAGYAFSHEEIVQYIMTIIPQEEVIVEATRKSVVSFPEIAIRELLANAMIHQDLQQRGTNPMVEVFKKSKSSFQMPEHHWWQSKEIVDSVPSIQK